MNRLLFPLVLLAAVGCAERTQIVVEVDSDLAVPVDIDGVEIVVTGSQRMSAMGSLRDRPLPRTLGLVPDGTLGPIEVRAIGTLGGVPVVERVATTSFVEGRTLVLPMFLSRACRGVTCPRTQTCDEGTCVASEVDPDTLEEYRDTDAGRPQRDSGPDRMDAAVDSGQDFEDAGPDGGPPIDAGPGPDAGEDAGPGPDAGQDAGAPDGGVDAGAPDGGVDAGPPDGGVDGGPDAGPPVDAGPRPCADIYGSLTGYQECAERPAECEFYVMLGGSSCDDFCMSVGGTCIEAYADGPGANNCTRSSGARSCASGRNDELCVCSRIP